MMSAIDAPSPWQELSGFQINADGEESFILRVDEQSDHTPTLYIAEPLGFHVNIRLASEDVFSVSVNDGPFMDVEVGLPDENDDSDIQISVDGRVYNVRIYCEDENIYIFSEVVHIFAV